MKKENRVIGGIDVTIQRDKDINDISIEFIKPDAHIVISAPEDFDDKKIENMFLDSFDYIMKRQKKALDSLSDTDDIHYKDGAIVLFFGKKYTLLSKIGDPAAIEVKGDKVILIAPYKIGDKRKEKMLIYKYKLEIRKAIRVFAKECEEITGIHPSKYEIQYMKTRWGTCNREKNSITVNLQIGMLPYECLRYLMIHELTHFIVPDHSEKFYEKLGEFYPDYKVMEKLLNGIFSFKAVDKDVK